MPLINTVIKRDGAYVNREDYYDLLTPQAFNFKLLYEAYKNNNNHSYTDETRIIFERFNIKPTFIQGGENLVKLTYHKDLPILEKLFHMQKEGKI
jgi:2-C-methyl-D-erythritol 4-phosphate cytidylyltransferase